MLLLSRILVSLHPLEIIISLKDDGKERKCREREAAQPVLSLWGTDIFYFQSLET